MHKLECELVNIILHYRVVDTSGELALPFIELSHVWQILPVMLINGDS